MQGLGVRQSSNDLALGYGMLQVQQVQQHDGMGGGVFDPGALGGGMLRPSLPGQHNGVAGGVGGGLVGGSMNGVGGGAGGMGAGFGGQLGGGGGIGVAGNMLANSLQNLSRPSFLAGASARACERAKDVCVCSRCLPTPRSRPPGLAIAKWRLRVLFVHGVDCKLNFFPSPSFSLLPHLIPPPPPSCPLLPSPPSFFPAACSLCSTLSLSPPCVDLWVSLSSRKRFRESDIHGRRFQPAFHPCTRPR